MAIIRLTEVIEKIISGEITRPRHISEVIHPADLKLLSGNSVLEKCEALLLTYKPATRLIVESELKELRDRLDSIIFRYRMAVQKALNIKDLWFPRGEWTEAHAGEAKALIDMHKALDLAIQDEHSIRHAGELYTRQDIEKLRDDIYSAGGDQWTNEMFNKLLGK